MDPFAKWNNQSDVVNVDNWLAQQNAAKNGGGTKQAQPKQNTNKGNFFTHLIPTLTGTAGGVGGGALGGALAGSAILPGIGTAAGGLLGALLGGAAGGAGGKVVENNVEHQGLGNGVGGQALEQGILSAGPIKLLKSAAAGGKALVGLGNVLDQTGAKAGAGSLVDAINAAGQGANKSMFSKTAKNLVTQGQAAQGRVAGVSAGSKIAGNELTPQDTASMLNTLKTEGIKTGNANNALRDVQNKLDQYGKQISDHFAANNTPLHPADVKTMAADFLNSLHTTDPGVLKQAQVVANDLEKNVNDTQGLWKFRVGLDSRIPDAKMAAGNNVLSDKLAAIKGMRQYISGQLGDIPGSANYHALSDVKPFISAEAKRLNNPGGGIVGRVAASGPVQNTENAIGKLAEKAGNSIGGTNGVNPVGLKAVSGRTLPVGLVQALSEAMPQAATSQNTTNPSQTTADITNSSNIDPLSQTSGDMSSGAGQSSNPYSRDNLIADIQRDPKNADKYISTYASLDKIFNPPQSTQNTIKPTGQQYGLATGGANALQQLAQLIHQDPSVVNKNATPGQGLPVVGSLISNAAGAGDYHALADNVLQSLIHLQTGATATPEEVKAARGQLPQPGDSQEVQQRKLSNLMDMLSPYIQGGQLGSQQSSQPDLASALMSAGYGQ